MVSFARTSWLIFLLIPILLALGAIFRHHRRLNQQRELASPAVWKRLMGGPPSTGLWRLLLWSTAAACILLALARPQWGEKEREISIRTRDLVFALDLSKSMECPDVSPDRLSRALATIRHSLPGLDGNRVGVVIFAGAAYPLVPLTGDLEAIASFLDGVECTMVSQPGSNIEAAADAAIKLLPEEGEGRVMVLFTDGENLQGNLQNAEEKLQNAGVSFIGVLVGTPEGGPIPEIDASGAVHYKKDRQGRTVVTHADAGTLQSMAKALEGTIILASGGEPEKDLIRSVDVLRTRELKRKHRPEKIDRFPLFLSLAAFLIILSFMLSPWRKTRIGLLFLLLGLSGPLQAQQNTGVPAGGPPVSPQCPMNASPPEKAPPEPEVSWWQRIVPGGVRRLARSGLSAWEQDDKDQALRDFGAAGILAPDDPSRLFDYGTALAESGSPEAAIPILEKAGDIEAAEYNAGTAALQAGKADIALQHLRRALLDKPEDPDIKRNYELALQLLQKKKEQQKQQDQKNKKDKNQKDQKDQDKKDQEKKDSKQEEKKQKEQEKKGRKPTPNPALSQVRPSPTPDPQAGLYSALQQSEAEARKAMRTPAPTRSKVEKDW